MTEFLINLKKVSKFAKNQKKNIILFIIITLLISAIGIVVPMITSMQLVNLTGSLFDKTLFATILLFCIEIFRNIINYFNRKISQIFFRETMYTLQTSIGKEILDIEVSSIDKHSTGTFTQRIASDTDSLSSIFTVGVRFFNSVITDLGVFAAVLIINPIFFLYYIASFMVLLLLQRKRVRAVGKKDRIYRTQRDKTAGLTAELVRGVRDIKMLNAEDSFMCSVEENILSLNQKAYDRSNTERKYQLAIGSMKDISDLLLTIMVLYFVSNEYIALSLGIVIFSYRHYVFNLVDTLGMLMDYVKDFNISCERVFALFESDEFKKERFGTKHLDKVTGEFEFKNVSFSYDNNEVLKDVNFKIKSGETVAFVGKSGAGKTTIFNLLCKMYDIENGNIYIDGNDISVLDKESIRGNITIISQNPYIFNMSIRDNLKLVKENLTEEEMISACKLACLHDFIESLPDKYDSVVGESGITLSGGQRQRLAIARALVQKTKIILFDEATSALDNETQYKIQQAINNMKKEYTILIIAHRLSTVKNSDRIIILDNGIIKGSGSHEELYNNNDIYRNLYEADMSKE